MGDTLQRIGAWLAATSLDEMLGFFASLMALIGVPWTLWQAWRARTASEAARDAARMIVRRRTLLDAVRNLPACIGKLDALQSQLMGGDWKLMADVVRSVRRELVELQEHRESFATDEHRMLQGAVAWLAEFEGTLLDPEPFAGGAEGLREVRVRLIERSDELHGLQARLRNRAVGGEHGQS